MKRCVELGTAQLRSPQSIPFLLKARTAEDLGVHDITPGATGRQVEQLAAAIKAS